MRRVRIIQAAVIAVVLVFMTSFVLQHAGVLLAEPGGAIHVHHKRAHVVTGRLRRASALHRPRPAPAAALPRLGRILFAPSFASDTKLVTNDYAYFNQDNPHAVRSADWIVTSGSLFARHGAAWTGLPDSVTPNADSTNGTGSATLRTVTRRRNFGNVAVSFDLLTQRFVTSPRTPAHSWDGVHVFLRYRSQHSLYVLSINRRDGVVLVKKKRPGGPANGGTYYQLGAAVRYKPPLGGWQHVLATITSNANKPVTITAYVNGRLLLARVDAGFGGHALDQPGAIGVRGDNTEFEFRRLLVRRLG